MEIEAQLILLIMADIIPKDLMVDVVPIASQVVVKVVAQIILMEMA